MNQTAELKWFAELIAGGQLEEAVGILRSRVKQMDHQADIDFLLESALLLWQCYEIEEAEAVFKQIVRSRDCRIDHLTLIAKRFFSIGQFAQAATIMAIANERWANSPDLLSQWSSCLERSNQLDAAIETAERAVQLDPSHVDGTRMLAHIQRRQGNYDAAINRLQAFLTAHPTAETWKISYELAACLDRQGDYDQAWHQLLAAKAFFFQSCQNSLPASYAIRQRQGELAKAISDADLRRWKNTLVQPTIPIAFLAGFPRSGTTLLESILTVDQEKVVGTDETGVLATQFIDPIVWQATDALDALLEIRGFESDQLVAGRQAYLKFTSALIGEAINDRLIIEKDPLLTCDLTIPLRLFPEAKIIIPLRDPRDVIISYFFTMVPIGWNSSPAINITEAAKFYHDVMRHWLLFKHRLPWDWIETKYEDLVSDPELEIQRVTDFLGISFDRSMIEPTKRSTKKLISTPTYDDITKPIYTQSAGRWQKYQSYLEPAMAILEPWAKQWGYE